MTLLSRRTGPPICKNILYGLLNGGLPQVVDLNSELDKNLGLIRQMAALHERLALAEMTGHEFLDKKSIARNALPLRTLRR